MKTLLVALGFSSLLAFPVFAGGGVDWKLKAKEYELSFLQCRLMYMQKDLDYCKLKIASINSEAPRIQKQARQLQNEIKQLKEKANEKTISKSGNDKPFDPADI